MAGENTSLEGKYPREYALFQSEPGAPKLVRSSTEKRYQRPAPPGEVAYTLLENLAALTLPPVEFLLPERDLYFEKRILTVEMGEGKEKRPVGYTLWESPAIKNENDPEIVTGVMFHGAAGSEEAFLPLARMFGRNKIRMIMISEPAHGDTFDPTNKDTWKGWMEDGVLSVLKAEDAKNILWVGSSMGGLAALWGTKLLPEKTIGCIMDNPIVSPVDNMGALRVGLAMAKEGAVHWWEGSEKNRSQFYHELFKVPFKAIKKRLVDGSLSLESQVPGGLHKQALKGLIDLLGTVPENGIGQLPECPSETERDPEFVLLTGRRDKATWAYKRKKEIREMVNGVLTKVYGKKEKPIIEIGFRGGHLNGFDRPWEYYAAHYNAFLMIADNFWEEKQNRDKIVNRALGGVDV